MAEFSKSAENMSDFEKMMCEMMVRKFSEDGHSLCVMGVEIDINPIGVAAHVNGNKHTIEKLGLNEEFEAFQKEISPIMEKFATAVADKYKKSFEEFSSDLSGGGTDKSDLMEILDAIKELLQ